MYSTNTNHQQDRGQQAPNVKPAPKGGHFVLHIEDVATDNDKLGLAVYWDTVRATANESDARRHETSMREWHGSQGSFTYYTIRDAGNILRAAEHWTMCRDCTRCIPSRPHLRQPGKQHECDLLGTDGHWYVDPEKDGCTWGTRMEEEHKPETNSHE
ncbi:MAG: hypothetical protein LIO47_09165 [Akkermansia sp.]|nr:hypothetical protein [Akkermansia sp.]